MPAFLACSITVRLCRAETLAVVDTETERDRRVTATVRTFVLFAERVSAIFEMTTLHDDFAHTDAVARRVTEALDELRRADTRADTF